MSDKKSQIKIDVDLDNQKIPESIKWSSTDNPENKDVQECKAFILSIFDKEHKDTLRIDLWTKEMQVAEMDRFVYFTLRGIAETYNRATNNTDLANQIGKFSEFFGEEAGILPKSDEAK